MIPHVASLLAIRIRHQVDIAISSHSDDPIAIGRISRHLSWLASDLFADLAKLHPLNARAFFEAAGVFDLRDPSLQFCEKHSTPWNENDEPLCPGCRDEAVHDPPARPPA